MIIWIDGTYGVGKTSVAKKVMEYFSDNEVELLESDFYSNESWRFLAEEAKANNSIPHICGILPQNNIRFIQEFRELIDRKSMDIGKKLIVDMVVTKKECKEELFDRLISGGRNIVHIILTADEETIKSRIKNDETRMKEIALDNLKDNLYFLDENFPEALWIKTDKRNINEIAKEVIEVIKFLHIT